MSAKSTSKFDRAAVLRWIPLDQIHVSPLAQRDLRQAWVDKILANLDLEQIGVPIVNLRDGDTDIYYVIDGQHRVAALRAFFEADPSIKIQCWTYFGLTQDVEAEKFLKLGDTLTIDAFSKFRIGVTAWRTVEVDIDRIVRANGSVVSRDGIPGGHRRRRCAPQDLRHRRRGLPRSHHPRTPRRIRRSRLRDPSSQWSGSRPRPLRRRG